MPATSVSASRCHGSVGRPRVKQDITAGSRAGEREPVMVRSQRTAEVQPVRTGQDTGHDLGVIVPAACAVTAVLAGLVTVVLAQGIRDATPADAPSPARPVEQVSPVQPGQPCRDVPASRSRFPARELVQAAERTADVLIGDEPVLGVRCRAVLVCSGR